MAENGPARSGPFSVSTDMTRSAMTTQIQAIAVTVSIRVVPGMVRIPLVAGGGLERVMVA